MYGDRANLLPSKVGLPEVKADPNLDAEFADPLHDRRRTSDAIGRSLERCEETVAGRIDLVAPETT